MKEWNKKILKNFIRYRDRWQRRIFKRYAIPLFDGLHPSNVFNYRYEFFEENVGPSDVVVDVGCGTGLILKRLSPRIKKGYGLELSAKNLELCRLRHTAENIEYIQANLLDFDFRQFKQEKAYDAAVLSHILEHLEDVPGFLKKLDAPKLLICVPSQENWWTQLKIHLGLNYFTDETHYREYTRTMLADELKTAGYQIDFMGFNPEGEIICRATQH